MMTTTSDKQLPSSDTLVALAAMEYAQERSDRQLSPVDLAIAFTMGAQYAEGLLLDHKEQAER